LKKVTINYSSEPICLKELRDKGYTYDDLKDECLKEVRKILNESQFGFCAYCERRLTSTIFIEHYKSRDSYPNLQLVFSNFLAVCSGKTYLCKRTGDHIEHCDTSKGDDQIKLDPRNKDHIATIYFESDSTIKSTDPEFNEDLNVKLKLNSNLLKGKREEEFNRNFKNLREIALKLNLDFKQTIQLGLEKSKDNISEYSGYINFRYLKLSENGNPT